MRNRGRFITLEGGEGAGKTTLLTALAGRLEALGLACERTREPGGTDGAEAIRGLLVTGSANRWSPVAELCLFYAARADHLERRVRPALAAGRWVLCDRFSDSTRAYQGLAGGAGLDAVEALDAIVVGGDRPDLTLVLDVPPETGLMRAASRRGGETRFEDKDFAFHAALREGYRRIAAAEPERCRLIDAGQPPEAVLEAAWAAILPLVGRRDGTGP